MFQQDNGENFGHSHHYSEMCSFHAQPILTARLRSASRCRADYRKGELSSLVASLFAVASVTVGNRTRGNTAPCLGTRNHLRDTEIQSFHSLVSELCTGVVAGVLGA